MSPLQCSAFKNSKNAPGDRPAQPRKGVGRPPSHRGYRPSVGGYVPGLFQDRVGREELSLLNALAQEMDVEGPGMPWLRARLSTRPREGRSCTRLCALARNRRYGRCSVRWRHFCRSVIAGEYKGHTGKAVTDVVNIGIGGSDLGPRIGGGGPGLRAKPPLRPLRLNVDGHHIDLVLDGLDPETTLFVVVSKTFTTLETMLNAKRARQWFFDKTGAPECSRHFVAVSTNIKGAM